MTVRSTRLSEQAKEQEVTAEFQFEKRGIKKIEIPEDLLSEESTPGAHSRAAFCEICRMKQPFRANHCIECRSCILLYDHHCVWLGVCIGERNRLSFWWYLLFQSALLWITAGLLFLRVNTNVTGVRFVRENWVTVIVLTLVSFGGVLVSALWAYHCFLALKNQTTQEAVYWENIYYLRDCKSNPFSKGMIGNLVYFCCNRGTTEWTLPRTASNIPYFY